MAHLSQITSEAVAANVRSHLAREGVSLTAFANRLELPPLWVLRRFGPSRSIAISVDDLAVVAESLGTSIAALTAAPAGAPS